MMPEKFSTENMAFRAEVLSLLLKTYGGFHHNRSIYECADDWIFLGNKSTEGLLDYYDKYFNI